MKRKIAVILAALILSACVQGNGGNENNMDENWITTWSSSQRGVGIFPQDDSGHTVHFSVPIQIGGDKVKISFSNYYGDEAVEIEEIGISNDENNNFIPLTFNGKKELVLEPKQDVESDEIDLEITQDSKLFVRVHYTDVSQEKRPTSAAIGVDDIVRSKKNVKMMDGAIEIDPTVVDDFPEGSEANLYKDAMEMWNIHFATSIQSVHVYNEESNGSIVAFGDSITEQGHWVNPLRDAVRNKSEGKMTVLNTGISGNRLLKNMNLPGRRYQYFGMSGLSRFEHDVFEINKNVKSVIISLGVNDIHQPGSNDLFSVEDLPTAQEMIEGYESLIKISKEKGVKVYLTTITPFKGYEGSDMKYEEKEKLRLEINNWIENNKEVDGVYDFNKAVSEDGISLNPEFEQDEKDHLHPNADGGLRMSEQIIVDDLIK